MKKTIFLFLLSFFGLALYAQDIIVLHTGETIEAIVQEINTDSVRYKRYSNPNGPTYIVMKADIVVIRYANGDTETFVAENRRRTSDNYYNYNNFTTGGRVATWAINAFLVPGLGSYFVMQDWVGGSIMMGLSILGLTLGTVGYFTVLDSLVYVQDDWTQDITAETFNKDKESTGVALIIAGGTVLLANGIYNIIRSATYTRPDPRRASGFDPSAFSVAIIPGKESKLALSYTMKF